MKSGWLTLPFMNIDLKKESKARVKFSIFPLKLGHLCSVFHPQEASAPLFVFLRIIIYARRCPASCIELSV